MGNTVKENYLRAWLWLLFVALLAVAAVAGLRRWPGPWEPSLAEPEEAVDWFLAVRFPELPKDNPAGYLSRMESWLQGLEENRFHPARLSEVLLEKFGKGARVPKRTIVLIFEPSYRTTYEAVEPILKRYGTPAVWLTPRQALKSRDHRFLSRHLLEELRKSSWWDVGFYDQEFDATFELERMPHPIRWGQPKGGQALNLEGHASSLLNCLSVHPSWTKEQLIRRLRAEEPIRNPAFLTVIPSEEDPARLLGVARPLTAEPEAFTLQAPLDKRAAAAVWPGIAGAKRFLLTVQTRSLVGELWLSFRSWSSPEEKLQIGFAQGAVTVDFERNSYQKQVARYAVPEFQEGKVEAALFLEENRLRMHFHGAAMPEIQVPELETFQVGLLETIAYAKIRGVARANEIQLTLHPNPAPNFRLAAGFSPAPVKSRAKAPDIVPGPSGTSRIPSQQDAIALWQSGRRKEAAELFDQLWQRQRIDLDLLKDSLWAYWEIEDYQKAYQAARGVLRQNSEDLEAWMSLAECLAALGENEALLKTISEVLDLNPKSRSRLRLARLAMDVKAYEEAERLLLETHLLYPEEAGFFPLFAQALSYQQRFEEAGQAWSQAEPLFPSRTDYRYERALCLYYAGDYAQAIPLLEELLSHPQQSRSALDFLSNDLIAQGRRASAAVLLEKILGQSQAQGDENRFLKLANLYQKGQEHQKALRSLDRCLQIHPMKLEALQLKAETLIALGRLQEAVRTYKSLLEVNPFYLEALLGLADLHFLRHQYSRALRTLDRALSLDPTHPSLVLRQARCLHGLGRKGESEKLLADWLQNHSGPFLIALVYHGLLSSERDPQLSSSLHLTAAAFEDQIRSLVENGFHPVTAEEANRWHRGELELPERSILISFDDARLDSLRYADPVLKKYRLRATMFVPIVNVRRNLPLYASWDQLRQFQRTGRWDFQSHGADASLYIPVDPQGHLGRFLANRKWLPGEGRLEALSEWRERIRQDYEVSRKEIALRLGKEPVAFAFPEGDFGQRSLSTVSQAAPENLKAVGQFYQTAYQQGPPYGFNPRSRNPLLLTRLEPKPEWTGQDLVEHILSQNPWVQMRLELLKLAVWDSRFKDANRHLETLKKTSAPAALLFTEEARILMASGQRGEARKLIRQALESDPSERTEKAVEEIRQFEKPVWQPKFQFFEDSRGREQWQFQQRMEWSFPWNGWLHLLHTEGSFEETGIPSVRERSAGLGYTQTFWDIQQIFLQGVRRFLSGGQADDALDFQAALQSRWTDRFQTHLQGGRSRVDTARALDANVDQAFLGLGSEWTTAPWSVRLKGRVTDFSDDNNGTSATAEASRQSLTWPAFHLLCRFTAEHSRRISPNYYSPQHLRLYQAGFSYTAPGSRTLTFTLKYLPGWGQEDEAGGSAGRFVHVAEAEVQIRLGKETTLSPFFSGSRTPTYRRNTLGVLFRHRF